MTDREKIIEILKKYHVTFSDIFDIANEILPLIEKKDKIIKTQRLINEYLLRKNF